MNGILLDGDSEYTASDGTSVVLSVAASLNDIIKIIAFKAEDASIADLVVNGDLTVTGDTLLDGGLEVTGLVEFTYTSAPIDFDVLGDVDIDGSFAVNGTGSILLESTDDDITLQASNGAKNVIINSSWTATGQTCLLTPVCSGSIAERPPALSDAKPPSFKPPGP